MSLNKIWKLKPPSPNAESLAHETGIDSLLAQLIYNRNIRDKESTISFLAPKLAFLLDPSELKDAFNEALNHDGPALVDVLVESTTARLARTMG